MKLTTGGVCALFLSLVLGLFTPSSTAYAQACGCGKTYVYVGDEEGEAVKGVTVEFLWEGQTLPNCIDRSPAKQIGTGRKFKFVFSAYERAPAEVLLRVTAPGYTTYEEKGEFMIRCGQKIEVVLRKTAPSYRTE